MQHFSVRYVNLFVFAGGLKELIKKSVVMSIISQDCNWISAVIISDEQRETGLKMASYTF